MSTVAIVINYKTYHIACEDGNEEIVQNLAKELGRKFDNLKSSSPTATTEYLLLLCALSMQNEISNSSKKDSPEFKEDYIKLGTSLEEILSITKELNK